MIPMRTSTIFKSRWLALLWAAGIIWFAYDFAGSGQGDNDSKRPTTSGAPITPTSRKLEQALNAF